MPVQLIARPRGRGRFGDHKGEHSCVSIRAPKLYPDTSGNLAYRRQVSDSFKRSKKEDKSAKPVVSTNSLAADGH